LAATPGGEPAGRLVRGRWIYEPHLEFFAGCGSKMGFLRGCASFDGAGCGSAWQLEDTGWRLRRRTGARDSLKWCGYCWTPPYSWWQLYCVPPDRWRVRPPPRWYEQPARWEIQLFGQCTHCHLLKDAMTVAERAYDEHILKVLASLW
jgi:hypothetical protein